MTDMSLASPLELPEGYTLGTDGAYQPGKEKIIVLRHGQRISENGWHMEAENAARDAWCHYYGEYAQEINAQRMNEVDHVQAWIVGDRIYSLDHLDIFVPLAHLGEVTIAYHGSLPSEDRWYIANLLCDHCGCAAVDDDILDEHGLLLNQDDFDEEEEAEADFVNADDDEEEN